MVTFLFTDIEGSTRFWEQHPEAMKAALARHDALLSQAVEAAGGHVFKNMGDACCAVFATAPAALTAALEAQQALATEPWGSVGPLRVRMALHTGTAEERGGDYFGPPLNRVARILAAGHGSQTLLSQATADLVAAALPTGASLRGLGAHRLKDLQQPEHIYQLLHPALPAEFAALRSLEAFRHNLPVQWTRFIGREAPLAEVKRLLTTTHLLTLTGSGGCGKTRLALQGAAELLEQFSDGVWLVELAALAHPALVPQAVAAALEVREEPGRPLLATLTEYLRTRSLLLVLDNCEHLLAACAQLAESLLRSCPDLRVLASSREGLGLAGEQTYRVPSLSLPDPAQYPSAQKLQDFEAVQLFLDRAVLSLSTFALTPSNASAVAQICRRLDGIPLAIELAASRVKALPVEKIAERLDDRFRLLTGGSRTALPRQQTLRALIDWSYDLLLDPERALLRRLSVFSGGWTLEAAEAVGSGDPIAAWGVLDLLTALVEKSLVVYEEQEERYRLLETVRQYARDRLMESGEGEAVRERHREWYLKIAEAKPGWERLEVEHDNLRAALGWSEVQGQGEAGLRLGAALRSFWLGRGYLEEGRERLEVLLALPGAEARTALRAGALGDVGWLAWYQGDHGAARVLFAESLALFRELDDRQHIAWSLGNLGWVAWHQGDYGAARALHEESLALFREREDKGGIAWSLGNLGWVVCTHGDYEAARALFEEMRAIYQELGHRSGIAESLWYLGMTAHGQGDYGAARALLEEGLGIFLEVDSKQEVAESLEGLAAVAVAQAQPERAARLFGAAAALCEARGASLPPVTRAERERTVPAIRALLGEEAFAAAWAAGRAMPLEQATSQKVAGSESENAPGGRPRRRWVDAEGGT